jgi:DnaJ like chaperone protein
MKYLIIIILIGIALYYAMKWQSSSRRNNPGGNQDGNPYGGNPGNPHGNAQSNDSGPYKSQGNAGHRNNRGSSYGKWVGGGLGWAFGGPIGGILGFMFGSMFDGMKSGEYEYGRTQSGDFNVSLLVLTAAVMKADGSVKRSELDYVKKYFYTNFGQEHGGQYIKMLGEIIKQDINVREVSIQIGRYMDYSSKLLLIQYLFGIALADGKHHPTEVNMINSISGYMGVGNKDYESIKAMFIKDTDSAYKILEVEANANDEDIKKAYRELAKKYHPDKVSHLGEDVKIAAEQKFTKLNAAYDAIKQERGMN